MPEGMYLDAIDLGEIELARKMHEIIQDKKKYHDFFRWHRYYSYHSMGESADTDALCALCAFLNNGTVRSERRVYARFTDWWNEYKNISKVNVNPIFFYGYADPNEKRYFTRHQNKFKVLDTPSIANDVGKLVNLLFNYYSES